MSGIEQDAIPVATPLIRGETFRLDEDGQRKLAAFLCLITMRMEFLGEMRAIPPSDRFYLKDHLEPPSGWAIWIARFAGEHADEHWARYCAMQRSSTPPEKVGPEHCNTQVSTMIIGKLCAHLFSSTELPIIGYEGVRLVRVWPASGFSINTQFMPALDSKTVLWLHEALARESKPFPAHDNPPSLEGNQHST